MAAANPAAGILVIGANHRSSSLALRDQLCLDEPAIPGFLDRLRAAGIGQALLLSTCDRIEVIAVHPDAQAAARAVTAAFAATTGIEDAALTGRLYRFTGADAVRHCFAVAAALDSLVIGEPHVLGQLKDAHRIAREVGAVGGQLESLLGAAYGVAKRVRSETGIAEGPVSIAAVAVQLARDLHGDLSGRRALLIGTGDMGELIAESLRAAGLSHFVVAAPREGQADAVASTLGGHTAPFADLTTAMAGADIVLSSLSGRQFVVDAAMTRQALRKRRQHPVFLIDAGIPGDIDPAVNQVDNAFLYDLNDLERVAMEGRASREASARAAWDIVAAEVTSFLRGRAERSAVPAIQALRQRFEDTRAQVLAEAGAGGGPGNGHALGVDADRITGLLIARLLHAPSESLREMAARGDAGRAEWEAAERVLRRLFRLDGAEPGESGTDAGQGNRPVRETTQ